MGILIHADTPPIVFRRSKSGIGFELSLKPSLRSIGLGTPSRVRDIILLRWYVPVNTLVFQTCFAFPSCFLRTSLFFRIITNSDILCSSRPSTSNLASSPPLVPSPTLRTWIRTQGGPSPPFAINELIRVRSRLKTLLNLFHPAKILMTMIV